MHSVHQFVFPVGAEQKNTHPLNSHSSSVRSYTHSPIRSFIHSLIHLFIRTPVLWGGGAFRSAAGAAVLRGADSCESADPWLLRCRPGLLSDLAIALS